MKWLIVIGAAVLSSVFAVFIAKSLGVESGGVIGGGVGGAVAAVVAIQMSKKKQ